VIAILRRQLMQINDLARTKDFNDESLVTIL